MSMLAVETAQPHARLDTLSARIRAVIEAKEITVTEGAKQAGVSRASFSGWLNGHVKPDTANLGRFCQATAISLEWLAIGKGRPPRILTAPPKSPRKRKNVPALQTPPASPAEQDTQYDGYLILDHSRKSFDEIGSYLVTEDGIDGSFTVEVGQGLNGQLELRPPHNGRRSNLKVLGRVIGFLQPA